MVNTNILKNKVVKFKLNHCCWLAPVNYGALLLGYLNLILTIATICSTVNQSFSSTLQRVQDVVLGEDANTMTPCTLAYSAEEAMEVLFLVGVHRRDLVLMGAYMYLGTAIVLLSVFTYIVVMVKLDFLTTFIIIIEILYHCFLLLLIRSNMVNIREEQKRLELEEQNEKQKIEDLELGQESTSEQEYEVNEENPAPDYKKLDTLLETSDEESTKNEKRTI